MRVFEALATGKLLVTDRVEYLDELFEDGIHLSPIQMKENLSRKFHTILKMMKKREEIARNGLDIVGIPHLPSQGRVYYRKSCNRIFSHNQTKGNIYPIHAHIANSTKNNQKQTD